MLSSVLRSDRAVQVNVEIMRTFVRLREIISSHKDLAGKLDELERKYDEKFRVVFDAIRQLMAPPPAAKRRPIGFHQTLVEPVPRAGDSLRKRKGKPVDSRGNRNDRLKALKLLAAQAQELDMGY
jgi:hypothetical protein